MSFGFARRKGCSGRDDEPPVGQAATGKGLNTGDNPGLDSLQAKTTERENIFPAPAEVAAAAINRAAVIAQKASSWNRQEKSLHPHHKPPEWLDIARLHGKLDALNPPGASRPRTLVRLNEVRRAIADNMGIDEKLAASLPLLNNLRMRMGRACTSPWPSPRRTRPFMSASRALLRHLASLVHSQAVPCRKQAVLDCLALLF